MKLVYFPLFLTCLHIVWSQTEPQVGYLQCLRDGTDYKMVLVVYLNDDAVSIMYGVDSAGDKVGACITGTGQKIETFGSGTGTFYKVEIPYNGATSSILGEPCGAETLTENHIKWRFATRTKPEDQFSNLVFSGDKNYEASCNFGTLEENLVVSDNVIVNGETSAVLEATEEEVSFGVVDMDGTTPVSDSTLGNQIRLRMELKVKRNGATGISPHHCKACDSKDCDTTIPAYTLTDYNGCYVTIQHIADKDDPSFTGTPADVKTIPFMNFQFDGASQTVWFICEIEFCYGANTADCSDRCSSMIGRRRRRRDVANKKNVTIGAPLIINVNANSMTLNVEDLDEATNGHQKGNCHVHMVFLGVTISLAVLLLATVVLSTRMYCLLQRSRGSTSEPMKP